MFWTNVERPNVKISISLKLRITTNSVMKNKILPSKNKLEILSKIYGGDDNDDNTIKLL